MAYNLQRDLIASMIALKQIPLLTVVGLRFWKPNPESYPAECGERVITGYACVTSPFWPDAKTDFLGQCSTLSPVSWFAVGERGLPYSCVDREELRALYWVPLDSTNEWQSPVASAGYLLLGKNWTMSRTSYWALWALETLKWTSWIPNHTESCLLEIRICWGKECKFEH